MGLKEKIRIFFKNDKFIIILFLVLLFPLYNYTNFFSDNWLSFPDDHEYYVLGKNLYQNGKLTIDDPLISEFEYPVFAPNGTVILNNHIVPKRSVGMYLLVAMGNIISDQSGFYFVPLISLVGTLYLYLLIKNLTNKNIALVSTFLFSFSAPVIFWSNMLYANIPSVMFFIIGLYYLERIVNKGNYWKYYLLAVFFLGLSVWFRYEYLFFILLLLPIAIVYRKKISIKKSLISILLLLTFLVPILFINKSIYDSPFVVGYTIREIENPEQQETTDENITESIDLVSGLNKIYNRFHTQLFSPDWQRVKLNINTWIVNFYPLIFVFCLLGIFVFFINWVKKNAIIVSLLVISVFWVYDNAGGVLYGMGKNLIDSTYVRYYLVVYLTMSVFAGIFIHELLKRLNRKLGIVLIAVFLAFFVSQTATKLLIQKNNLIEYSQTKEYFYSLNKELADYSDDSVFITKYTGKHVTNKKIFDILRIPSEIRRETSINYIIRLLDKGYPIYFLEPDCYNNTIKDIYEYFSNQEGYFLKQIKQNPYLLLQLTRTN